MIRKRLQLQLSRLIVDGLIALAAFWGVCFSLINQELSWWTGDPQGRTIILLGVLYAASMMLVFLVSKIETRVWHVVSARDVGRIIRMTVIGALLFLGLTFITSRAAVLPRSILLLAWFVTAGGMAGVRLMFRAQAEGWLLDVLAPFRMRQEPNAKPMVVLVGPSVRVQRALFDIRDTNAPYRPIGVVLEDLPARNAIIGARVLGATEEIASIVEMLAERDQLKFSLVFVTPPTTMQGIDEAVMAKLNRIGAPILRLPKITELTEQDRMSLQFRPVRLEELLSRPPVNLNNLAFTQGVRGKRILVTGAGGSIGSELCRQIAALGCGRLILLDLAETPLFEIDREIGANYPSLSRRAILGDVRDPAKISAIIAEARLADGDASGRRNPDQRGGHGQCRARGARARRGADGAAVDRQGREPVQRDGRDQALGRGDGAGAERRRQDTLLCRALRQRAELQRLRRADFPPPDCQGWAGDGDSSGGRAFLHDDSGGGAAGAARGGSGGDAGGARSRRVRAGNGRAGEDHRHGAADDRPAGAARPGKADRDQADRPAAR
jgi:hypothetical protein